MPYEFNIKIILDIYPNFKKKILNQFLDFG